MNKRICAISTVEGTMNSFIVPAMEYFIEKGFDVTLVCNMSESFIQQHSGKFHCVSIPMKRGISLSDLIRVPRAFRKLFKNNKFDYVQYATTNASFYAALPAKLAGIKTRVYCQWGLLYVGYSGLKRRLFKWVEKYLCRLSTHVTVASKQNLEFAVKEGLMPRNKASVIGDGGTVGVDLSVFDIKKSEEFRNLVLIEHPELRGRTVFGFVGRIETDKGITELLEAFLSLSCNDYALLLIGAFDELRSNIPSELIAKSKETRRVIFHGFTREVPKYLSAIDILVHPTYREGFSMVIQQAMAMGCAIITTNVPGPSEVIEEGKSGLLVRDHSSEDLAVAMARLGSDVGLRESLAASGLERVSKLFNRQRMLELTYEDRLRMMGEN
ncbi:MAG: glycosyltransferase family 4 protein [Paludibacteraceae bacterium]|nr:glycosyltransferase family 4 protein [Paludibacteraceae bacterium]